MTRRFAHAVLTALGGGLAAIHCSDPPASPVTAPRNVCDEHACAAFQQPAPTPQCDEQRGYCHVNASFDYLVFVTMPAESRYAPGATFMMTGAEFARPFAGAPCRSDQTCTLLPSVGTSRGVYQVTSQDALDVNRFVGNPGVLTTIPVNVVFRPLAPNVDLSASDLGFPLPAQLATATTDLEFFSSPPRGPFDTPAIGWSATLPVGRYERILRPAPPFDDAFPPSHQIVEVTGRGVGQFDLTLDDVNTRTFTIESSPGALDLEGFTVALESSITRRRISRVATLASGPNEVELYTSGFPVLQDVPIELVLAPPRDQVAVPSLVAPANPASIAPRQTYPVVPPPVEVSGRVVAQPNNLAVPARVLVSSVPEVGAILSSENVLLRYETELETDAEGRFAMMLPPGRFDIGIVPDVRSGYAMAISTLVVNDRDPVQGGKSFAVARKARLEGFVELADGTPLAAAEVEARPAVEPGNVSPSTAPTTSTLPLFSRSMRTAQVRTGADGSYSLELDPGYFDVVVKPREGTRFPWVVSTSHKIEDKDVALEKLIVPAPIRLTRTLLARASPSSAAFPVRGALVRAFTIPPGKNIAVEIGRAVSSSGGGTDGLFELFLAGRPR